MVSFGEKAARIVKSGFVNFLRNTTVSLASLLVFTVALFLIASLVLGNALLDAALLQIKDKIDIVVYLKHEAAESDAFRLKESLETLPEVREVIYRSEDAVLAEFRERHSEGSLILQSLEELGDNPFPAELNIRVKEPEQYSVVVNFLESRPALLGEGGESVIEKVNVENEEKKATIERFIAFANTVERVGLYLTLATALIAVLVTFNTIRLAIYTAREEISVMKLVGASDNYIRGPFVVEGIIYGIISTCITLVVLYPVTRWLGPETERFFGNINVFEYYLSEFPLIFFVVLLAGVGLGAISSILAVRRYLNV